jgi:hypothetical protein
MNGRSVLKRSLGSCALMLAVGAIGSLTVGEASAGCGMYDGPAVKPAAWDMRVRDPSALMHAVYRPGSERFIRADFDATALTAGIVGLWKFQFISDGTAYPAPIPYGALVDFGTVQWHSDGTEIMFSGGRPPSSGDVCMGVWEKTGTNSYALKHVALAWISSDTPPPLGPKSPAVFVGPAIIREVVTLDRAQNHFAGSFTIDQYAQDETTLLQHIGGKVTATRITVD